MTRKIISVEIKRDAAQLVPARGVIVAQASKDIDVRAIRPAVARPSNI